MKKFYDNAIVVLTVTAFSIMLGAAFLGTIARYLTFLPTISWGEEVTRYAGIWSVFLVAGLGVRNGAHLGVDALTRSLPFNARRINYLIVYSLMLGFALILLIYGIQIVLENTGQTSAALEWPMAVIYLCVPIGGMLMIVEIVPIMLRLIRGRLPAHIHQEPVP